MQAGDVERVERFLLHLVVIDAGVLADEHLRHGVGEIGLARRADVALDDLRLRVGAGDDQRARVRHHRRAVGARDEDDVDRRVDDGAVGQVDERAVLRRTRC